jgi:hypothetical protein
LTVWQRHQDEAAWRIYALPLPWSVKFEIWKEEMCQFETTFWRVLMRCNLQPLSDELQDPNE